MRILFRAGPGVLEAAQGADEEALVAVETTRRKCRHSIYETFTKQMFWHETELDQFNGPSIMGDITSSKLSNVDVDAAD
jgi:hypothetical protein